MNYQNGGWYDNPATGKNQQYMNGQWSDSPQQGNSSQPASADQYYNDAASKENQYVDSLLAQAGGQKDLAIKQLDAQHKLALGNDDTQTAQFLESVASALENKIGRIPYDYQTYTGRENTGYGINSGQIGQTRQLALAKLAEDERAQTASINLNQGQQNQSTAESLNSRGLINGSAPTGLNAGAPTTQGLGNINGIGGQIAGNQNQDFANQRTALANSIGLGQQGANLTANQQQQSLDFSHANTLQDLTTNARRDTQDQQNTYQFGVQGANLDYKAKQAALERQRQSLLQQDRINSYTKAGLQNGVLGY